jgi:hypothetical protein
VGLVNLKKSMNNFKLMKRQVLILFVLTIFFCTVLPAQAANLPPITGVQFFPADHIWNVPIDKLPVDSKSNTYINSANPSAYLYVYKGYFYNIVDSSQPKQYMTSIKYASVSDKVPVPIPKGVLVETGSSDHNIEIIDKDSKLYYNIYAASQAADGTWSCGSLAVFDLSGYALRPDGWTSDEAGLPILPGLLRYDEVASGEIDHALRVGLWVTQNTHVWPARHNSGIANTAYSPLGQRFRLKASVDISKYTPQQQVILKALKKYGMMVATQTGQKNIWALSAVPDSRWDSDYATFSGIKASDFEAVDVSSLMINEDSGKARITTVTTPTPTPTQSSTSITITSPNGGETWQRGTPHTVTWDYTDSPGSTVKITLLKSGTEVGTIISSTSVGSGGHGSYTWPINPSGTTGSDYKVSVQSISQPTVKDTSNNYLTLSPAGTATPSPTQSSTSITITSPNGGETWQRGTPHTVTWDYTGSPGSTVKIALVKAGTEVGTIISSTSTGSGGKGSYTWLINPSGTTGSDYKVSVQSISQPTIKDTSNNYFIITPQGTIASSITVTSPNGGETWQRGTSHTVTWDYTGSPGSTVKIVLVKAGSEVGTIIASTPIGTSGKGSYTWPINPSGTTGSDYKVSVQSLSQPTIKDVSNGYFGLTL